MINILSDGDALLEFLERYYSSNPWICWGVVPATANLLAMVIGLPIVETLLRMKSMRKYHIEYRADRDRERLTKVAEQTDPSWSTQTMGVVYDLPANLLVNIVFLRCLYGHNMPDGPLPSSWTEFFVHFFLVLALVDFQNYWIHRWSHEIPLLWKYVHSKHHQVESTTGFSFAYGHYLDSFLVLVIPTFVALNIVRPHPLTFAIYIYYFTQNQILDHCGLEIGWLNLIALYHIPGITRSVAHHDMHHRFGNRPGTNGRNYGNCFLLWDYAFGTYMPFDAVGKKKQKSTSTSVETNSSSRSSKDSSTAGLVAQE